MDIVAAFFVITLIAGVGIGAGLHHYLITRPLIKEILVMKREGFSTPPKTIRPPEDIMSEIPTFRED